MSRSLFPLLVIVAAIAAGAFGWNVFQSTRSFSPAIPAPELGAELLGVFQVNPDRRQAAVDAQAFSSLCQAIADVWSFDGAQAPPRLTRQSHLAELRQVAREYRLQGVSLNSTYPSLGKTLESYLSPILPPGKGSGAVEVTADVRQRWVESHRKIAEAARWAASNL